MKRIIITLALASCFYLQAQTPVIPAGGIINGASFATGQGVAPGSVISIFGTDLAGTLTANDTVPLSMSLADDVTVMVNNIPAGLYFVSQGQVNAQIPWNVLPDGTTSGVAQVVVTRNKVASAPQTVNVVPAAPGIFYLPNNGGWAIAFNTDGAVAAPVNSIPGINTHPAKAGDILAILSTGGGQVDSPIANGADSADKLRNTLIVPQVLVNQVSATVLFSGLAPQFPGLNQINFSVPGGIAAGTVPLQLQANGITSTDAVKIALM
jgi:minor extracellular serine protease Vpr